jgi:hypothetical protein
VPSPEEQWVYGVGNTLLSWDGVHANSAGYALAANKALEAVNEKLKNGSFGGLELHATLPYVDKGTRTEEGSITWLLFEQYLDLGRTRGVMKKEIENESVD